MKYTACYRADDKGKIVIECGIDGNDVMAHDGVVRVVNSKGQTSACYAISMLIYLRGEDEEAINAR